MAFYQLSFIKLLRFNFIGTILVLIIYLFFNDINVQISKESVITTFPKNTTIKKIDVGQGEDIWVLDIYNKLYHWSTIKKKLIYKVSYVHDFSVSPDGIVAYSDIHNRDLYIRSSIDYWRKINGNHYYDSISVCDYDTIFAAGNGAYLIRCSYSNNGRLFNCNRIGSDNVYQTSCAFHDHSLWVISTYDYVYLYDINNYRRISRSEIQFKQIKALSKQHAIGIDYNDDLWEYVKGTWTWIRSNVKSASINYDGNIFYIDTNNIIYKTDKQKLTHII